MRYLKASMLKRRVTVHFGAVRVVVPCPEDTLTVRDLASAAILRYKKATGRTDSDVRVMHMECLRDGGILDMDDRLVEVFDEATDQILAIYDEQSPNGSDEPGTNYQVLSSPYPNYSSPAGSSTHSNNFPSSRMTSSSSITTCNVNYPLTNSSSMDMGMMRRTLPNGRSPYVHPMHESMIEMPNIESIPTKALRVSPPCDARPGVSSSSSGSEVTSPPIRSSLRSETATPSKHRVTMSPEVEKRIAENSERDGRLTRSSARKSRISDTFFEAKDRLDEMQQSTSSIRSFNSTRRLPLISCVDDPEKTIITLPDDDKNSLGIEVIGIFEDPSTNTGRLSAVQIIRIDSNGRVGRDGRLVAGDNIVSIDGRPVYQMSVFRARAYLNDLSIKPAPTLTIARAKEHFHSDDDEKDKKRNELLSSQKKPILSALQQANTSQALGQNSSVQLTKSNNGFGFTVTGRETTKGERLFYIGTVKPNGVALGHLRAGDRLLQINGDLTSDMTQSEVVERLKKSAIGETVEFIVSRVADENKENNGIQSANSSAVHHHSPEPLSPVHLKGTCDIDELKFEVPLNSTGSAGLGVSLKARVTVKSDKSRHDCGIFIKSVLHNGAAFKDGRLRVDDRIIGIEELNLIGMTNSSAGDAVTRRLKAIDPSCKSVTLIVHRKVTSDSEEILTIPSLRESSSEGDKRSSTASEQPSICRLDESELASCDPFDREAPTRKSMSEKRGMGASLDPNHLKLFQEIKHQRQSSAPPPSLTSSSSFHGHAQQRSASQRAAARARSQSVHPREVNPSKSASRPHVSIKEPSKRRSLSVESLNVAPNGDARIGQLTQLNRSRQADIDDFYASSPHPFPPGSPVVVVPRQSAINKERQRRKSVGSTMKSWFGFGSKSRDSSPEKGFDRERERREKEDMRRVQEHYDRARREDEMSRSHGTPNATRRDQQMYQMYSGDHPYQNTISSYHDYELVDRFQAHRYPDGPSVIRPTSHHPATPPPAYHYALPSSKSYHGSTSGASPIHPGYGSERTPVNRRAAAPDYYHMFNSWFAYSGGGGVGAAPSIKAAYGNSNRPAINRPEASASRSWSRSVPSNSAIYAPPTEPSQLYSRFSNY